MKPKAQHPRVSRVSIRVFPIKNISLVGNEISLVGNRISLVGNRISLVGNEKTDLPDENILSRK